MKRLLHWFTHKSIKRTVRFLLDLIQLIIFSVVSWSLLVDNNKEILFKFMHALKSMLNLL